MLPLSNKIKAMDLQTAKVDVVQKIMNISTTSLLEKISHILDEEMIVAYTTTGKPLTRQMYDSRLAQAEMQIKVGNTTSQEDLEKQIGNW